MSGTGRSPTSASCLLGKLVLLLLALILGLTSAACQPAAAPVPTQPPAPATAQQPSATAQQATAPQTSAATGPAEVRIAVITTDIKDQPWVSTLVKSLDKIATDKPHGLKVTYDVSEKINRSDIERVMRQAAASGKYDIIWGHSTYSDQEKILGKEFPELVWVDAGGGNQPIGGNVYWVDMDLHEATYLMGIAAGKATKSNTVGIVADYPYENVNQVVNGFADGVKAANPGAKILSAFIQSWYDPPKAKEAALAQIAEGADQVFAATVGPFEACVAKGAKCYGLYEDQNYMAPTVVVSSAMLNWYPHVKYIIDAWWDHKANAVPYNAPMKAITFGLKDGGADMAPYHDLESSIPQPVKDAVTKARQDILNATLVIKASGAPLESK